MKLIKSKRTVAKYLKDKETLKQILFQYICPPVDYFEEGGSFIRGIFSYDRRTKGRYVGNYFVIMLTKEEEGDLLERIMEEKEKLEDGYDPRILDYIDEEVSKEIALKIFKIHYDQRIQQNVRSS